MIIPGARAFQMGILRNLCSEALQIQPCGIDLTLKRVLRVTTAGAVHYDSSKRLAVKPRSLSFLQSVSARQYRKLLTEKRAR